MRTDLIIDDFNASVTFRLVPENDIERSDLKRLTKALSRRRLTKPVVKTLIQSSEDDVILSVS